MNRIAVFCGAASGSSPIILQQAALLGQTLAQRGIELVYGGAKLGVMGAVADAVLQQGGRVTGVLPYFLKTKEVAHEGIQHLISCRSMHERKTKMYELSDGFIALPGGFGTMDELFEVLTWAQLGLHQKPVALLNIDGFFDPLCEMIEKMLRRELLTDATHSLLLASDNIEELLHLMQNYQAPLLPVWLHDKEEL